jgi:putative inorganic carbon (HCO3(-)) transporter
MHAPLLFLIATMAVGLAASADVSASLPGLWRILLGVAVFYGLAIGIRGRRGLRLLTLALAIGTIGGMLLTLFGTNWGAVRFLALPGIYGRLPALLRDPTDGGAFHPRVMGMALAAVFPLCLAVAIAGRDRPVRALMGLAALLTALVLPLTQSVQAVIGISAALFLLLVWRTRWALLILPIAAAVAGWGALRFDYRQLALRFLSIKDPAGIGVALRLDMWSRALAMLRDTPFTGIGLDSFPTIQWHFYPGYLLGPEPHAHNLFLQIALDLGLPGLGAFIWLLAAAAVLAVQTYRRSADHDVRALIAGLSAGGVAYLGCGVIDTPWVSKPGIVLWVLLGSLAAVRRVVNENATVGTAAGPVRRAAALVAWVLPPVLLALALALLPAVRELNLGALQGRRAVIAARAGGSPAEADLGSAAGRLARALPALPDDPHIPSLLGSVFAWQGDYQAALDAFARQVAVDGRDPMRRYAPFEAWRRELAGEPAGDPWQDLLRVYGQWMARFPSRAEPYVWAAIVRRRYQGNPRGAVAVLRAGLDHGAQPRGLLTYSLSQVEQGN